MSDKLAKIIAKRSKEEDLSPSLTNEIIEIFKKNPSTKKADNKNKSKQIVDLVNAYISKD